MTNSSRRSPWIAVALAALFVLALVERFTGLGFLLPHQREADAVIVFTAAYHDLPEGAPPTDSAYASTFYPLLLSGILVMLPGSNYPLPARADAPLEDHLAAASEPYLRARRLIALLSLLVVPCTYLLARHWLSPWWSVFAAALATTSVLILSMSTIAKPHGALLGLGALSLVAILWLLRSASLRAYAAAGVTTGLALSSLYTGCFLLPSLVIAHWFGWRADRERKRWIGLAVALSICAAAFVLAYPFLLAPDTSIDRPGNLNFGQQSISWKQWNFAGFGEMVPWMLSTDPVLVVLVGSGLVLLAIAVARGRVRRQSLLRPEVLVIGSFVLLTVFLFGLHGRFFPRFFAALIPVLCIGAAAAVRGACTLIPGAASAARNAACAAVALGVLAFPAWCTAKYAMLHAREDTESAAARWIQANIAPDAGPIALDFALSLPLAQTRESLLEVPEWWWKPWQRYQAEIMPADARATRWDLRTTFQRGFMADKRIDREEIRARMAAIDPKWAVVAVAAGADRDNDQTCLAVRELAGEPVVRILAFPPGSPEDQLPPREIDKDFLWHMLARERPGPRIEIYRMR